MAICTSRRWTPWRACTRKLSVGGYVIIDDVGSLPPCAKAVEDYRSAHHITSEVKRIDWTGVYWQKEQGQ